MIKVELRKVENAAFQTEHDVGQKSKLVPMQIR